MYGEVVNPLLRLLYEGVPVNLPGKFLRFSINLFKGLVYGNGPHGNRGISYYPLPGFVDVVPGREIHYGVGSPPARPDRFFDLLFNA